MVAHKAFMSKQQQLIIHPATHIRFNETEGDMNILNYIIC